MMSDAKINPLKILLLILVLFSAQYAAMVHASDHPFHQADQACQVFHTVEHSSDALFDYQPQFYLAVGAGPADLNIFETLSSRTPAVYSARAPPVTI